MVVQMTAAEIKSTKDMWEYATTVLIFELLWQGEEP